MLYAEADKMMVLESLGWCAFIWLLILVMSRDLLTTCYPVRVEDRARPVLAKEHKYVRALLRRLTAEGSLESSGHFNLARTRG